MSTKAKKGRFYKFKGLTDVEGIAQRSPGTIERSSGQDLQSLKAGNAVQLIFEIESNVRKAPKSEKLWLIITKKDKSGFKGKLLKNPLFIQNLSAGKIMEFEERHILYVASVESRKDEVERIEAKRIMKQFGNGENLTAESENKLRKWIIKSVKSFGVNIEAKTLKSAMMQVEKRKSEFAKRFTLRRNI
jgi:hypothetical protein